MRRETLDVNRRGKGKKTMADGGHRMAKRALSFRIRLLAERNLEVAIVIKPKVKTEIPRPFGPRDDRQRQKDDGG